MNSKTKKIIAVFIFIIIFGILLRLLKIPFYIFRDTKWESLVIILTWVLRENIIIYPFWIPAN